MRKKKVIKSGDGVVLVGSVNSRYAPVKRGLDILGSAAGIVVTSPILLGTALAVKLNSPKDKILFRQTRTGKDGREFSLLKFRSMVPENDVMDASSENKYTKVGKFIRKTSIDELPQLFNVLRGDMSLIGPRPWIPEYYNNMNDEQRRKYDVKPGITGLAQVSGRNSLSVFDRINYDLIYVDNYSLKQDIKVLAKTARAVLFPKRSEAAITKSAIHSDIDDLIWSRSVSGVMDASMGIALAADSDQEFDGVLHGVFDGEGGVPA